MLFSQIKSPFFRILVIPGVVFIIHFSHKVKLNAKIPLLYDAAIG
jgi:hypothetical protein